MSNLIKEKILILSPYAYIGIMIVMMVRFVIEIAESFIFIVAFFALVFSLYTYDDRNHVHRFIISLPVKKADIIRGRYIYSLFIIIILLFVLWGWMGLLSLSPLLTDSHYVYHWRDMIVMFAIGGLMISFGSPLLYRLPFYVLSLIIFISLGFRFFFSTSAMLVVLAIEDAAIILFNDI